MANIQLGTIALLSAAISVMLGAGILTGIVSLPAPLVYPAILVMVATSIVSGILGVLKRQGRIAAITAILALLVLGAYVSSLWTAGR